MTTARLTYSSAACLLASACSGPPVDEDLLEKLRVETAMPDCAVGSRNWVEDGLDGIDGQKLAAYFAVGEECKAIWLRNLSSIEGWECSGHAHGRSCNLGDIRPDGDWLLVMARENDMLVVDHVGSEEAQQ